MKTKTASVEQYITSRINSGELLPDSRIPSQFKLMQQFACSRIIIQRALKNLCSAGYLYSVRGSGTFVRPGPYGDVLKEVIIVSEYSDTSPHYPFSGMLFGLNAADISVRWINQQFINRHSERFFTPGQTVLWVLPSESQIMLMHQLHQKGIPQLLINRNYGNFNFISTDHWTSIREGLQKLCRDGDKKVALITPPPDANTPYMAERLLAFFEECSHCGISVPSGWLIKRQKNDPENFDNQLEKLFNSTQFPRKIFISQEKLLTSVILAASKCGRTLGADYEILVFDQPLPSAKGLFMLHQPMNDFRAGVEEFIRRTAKGDRTPFQMRLKTELICGE